jgi:hypothetical protein
MLMRNSTGTYADTVLKPMSSNKSYSTNGIAEFEQIAIVSQHII